MKKIRKAFIGLMLAYAVSQALGVICTITDINPGFWGTLSIAIGPMLFVTLKTIEDLFAN